VVQHVVRERDVKAPAVKWQLRKIATAKCRSTGRACRLTRVLVPPEECHDLAWFQNWYFAPTLRHIDGLCANEHTVEARLTLLEEHADHLLQIAPQFVEGLSLTVPPLETGYPTHVQTGVRVSFDDGSGVLHELASLLSDDTRRLVPALTAGTSVSQLPFQALDRACGLNTNEPTRDTCRSVSTK